MGLFSKLGKKASKTFDSVTEKIGDGLSTVGDGLQAAGNFVVDGVQSVADKTVDTIQSGIHGAVDFGQSAVGFVGNVATGAIDGVGNGIEASVGDNIVSKGLHAITKGANNIGDFANGAVDKTQNIVDGGIDNIQSAGNGVIDSVQKGANALADGGQKIVDTTYDVAQDLTSGVVDKGSSAVGAVGDVIGGTVKQAGETAVGAVKPTIDKIGNGLNEIKENLTEGIKDVTKDIAEDANTIGKAVGETHIGHQAGKMVDSVKSVGDNVKNGISSLFKNTKGQETEASITKGIQSLAKNVAKTGHSTEIGLKNGQSLLFNAVGKGAKVGVEIFSSQDLKNPLAKTDKQGDITSGSINSVLDAYSQGNNLMRSSLSISNDKTENNLNDTLSAVLNLNEQQTL